MAMDDLFLAFYKAPGTATDRIIRAVTRSPYSHCELVRGEPGPTGNLAISASLRDGGVRQKVISFRTGRWDVLPVLAWASAAVWDRASASLGAPYDISAILTTFVVPLRRHSAQSWTCSEHNAHALGLTDPHLCSPGDLAARVRELNIACSGGQLPLRPST